MLANLIQFSLTQRLIIAVVILISLVLGTRAWKDMPIDAFPDISLDFTDGTDIYWARQQASDG
jgi:Cu/Ag efflux pump CusA